MAAGLTLGALAGCARAGGGVAPVDVKSDPKFYDYSAPRVGSLAEFQQLAAVPAEVSERPPIAGAKFVVTSFSDAARRRVHFLDGRYYRFHDEWAWFRLLNGQAVTGMLPLVPHAFAAPEDARRWAEQHEDELPSGLEIVDGRLYVRSFYDLSLSESGRPLGAGSLIHVAARGAQPELWGFEIEYSDPAGTDELRVFADLLDQVIPQEARGKLRWFARSPEQLEVGKRWAAEDPRMQGRVLTYADVSIPGETQVYTGGIVAGRLKAFRDLSRLADAEPEDILLLGALPPYLPQARGLITSILQTPLAHLNLLAKSRQIVNAYRGAVLDDPDVQDLVRSRAPVVLLAENGQLKLHRLTDAQYKAWQDSLQSEPPPVTAVDVKDAPYLVDLSQVDESRLRRLAPLIGGKNVGMARILLGLGPGTPAHGSGTLGVDVPDRPLALSIRAYREHLAPILPELRALLADENFQKFKKLRFLALEGSKEFVKKFPGRKDRELARSYENPAALGAIASFVRKGGVAYVIRQLPLPAALEAELKRVLPVHFAAYAPEQGLRFRSSSTVEDIEGFNGAGLYDSNTGFLVPRPAQGKEPKRASVADALKKTWASYFSFEAFEERHQNRIDHLSADMGVLIHARFDDAMEQSNGVFTFTLGPNMAELSVDAQPGAVSVTNPPTDRVVIPESSRVRKVGEKFTVTRQSLSSLTKAGELVLTDAELSELYGVAKALTDQQLLVDNAGVPAAQRRHSLVLDFEFRRVRAGWPALRQGLNPARFVVKQMRPLEPSPHVSAELRQSPIPHDVLARARRIETRLCRGPGLELQALSVLTNPDAAPDVGYARTPLLAGLGVTRSGAAPRVFTHVEQLGSSMTTDGFEVELQSGLGLSSIAVESGKATVVLPGGARRVVPVSCETRLDYAEPRELLRSYVASSR